MGLIATIAAMTAAASGQVSVGEIVVIVVIVLIEIAASWRIFEKAGRPGWAAIVPIYNAYVLLKIVGRPGWWLLLYLVPILNYVIVAVVIYDLARSFGKGIGWTLGLIFLSFIFYPVLGFGSAQYAGPWASRSGLPRGGYGGYGGYGGSYGGAGYGTGSFPSGSAQQSPSDQPGSGWSDTSPGGSRASLPVSSTAQVAPQATTAAAGWYADPSSRHEYRYFDGRAWTEHVSDAGQQSTDPI